VVLVNAGNAVRGMYAERQERGEKEERERHKGGTRERDVRLLGVHPWPSGSRNVHSKRWRGR
jgi:hypothetical protein